MLGFRTGMIHACADRGRRALAAGLIGVFVCLLPAAPASATMPPLQGPMPPALSQALRAQLLSPGVPGGPRGMAATQATSGTWRIPVVLVSFADDSVNYSAADFERLLFDTTHAVPTGSVAEYWRWVSSNQIQLTGRVVTSVVLPETQAYYAGANYGVSATATPRNDFGLVQAALRLGEGAVNWTEFDTNFDGYVDMVWFLHAGTGGEGGDPNRLWSISSRLSGGWTDGSPYPTTTLVPGSLTRAFLIDRFTMLPELSLFHPGALSEIGVFAHEFGHTLGLPDLYDVQDPRNTGPGNWSLMGSGGYGGDGHSPEYPTHIGAWPVHFFGWDHVVRPTRDTTLTLGPLERSADLIDFWCQGEDSPEHFLIENRRRIGFDRNLPGEGLIVYHVNETMIGFGIGSNTINSGFEPGLMLVEGDGDADLWTGRNRGDANDPLPGALNVTHLDDFTQPTLRTFGGLLTNVAVESVSLAGDSTRVRLRVRPPGWLPAEDWTGSGYSPVSFRTPAHITARDPAGIEYVALSEYIGSWPQVVLRSSAGWGLAQVMSRSPSAALDPSLAMLPNGDLGLVWSDTRRGHAEIYYRARIRGSWTDEGALVSLPGNCATPALGADGRGGMALAFQYQHADTNQIRFMRFNYARPAGQSFAVSTAQQQPENPVVCADANGSGYLLWQDRRPNGKIWFASFRSDSGVRSAQPVSSNSGASTAYAAALDSSGTLYVIWNQSGPNVNQLVLQTRGGLNGPITDENPLESLTLPLESLALEVDGQRSIHLAYAVAGTNGLGVRYRRRWPNDQWDASTTDLSFPDEKSGGEPILLPRRDGNVDVLYNGNLQRQAHLMLRRRVLAPERTTDVPFAPRATAAAPLVLAPNPARAGAAIVALANALPAGGTALADVFDAGGRRMATLALAPAGAGWGGRLPGAATATWPGGVYFVRVRGQDRATRVVVLR
jgi:M6 family metalloprotease-like protein